MVYLPDTKKQKGQEGESDQPMIDQGGTPFAGGGSPAGTSMRQQGTGGRSPWTNIQAYLNANRGTEGSSSALQETVGGALSKEKGALESASQEAIGKAKGELGKTDISESKAEQLIKESAATGQKGGIQQLQGALGAQYQGPQGFNYTTGQDVQGYLDVGSEPGFKNVLSALYGRRGLGTGQRALQNQLDIVNPQVQAQRGALGEQAAGLSSALGTIVPQTNADVVAAQSQFGNQQNALRNYLTQQQAAKRSEIDAAVNAFNQNITDTERRAAQAPGGEQTRHYTTSRRDEEAYNRLLDKNRIMPGSKEEQFFAQTNQPAEYAQQDFTLSADPFRKYTPGVRATAGNLAQVDPQRSEYNAMLEALGMGGQIAPESVKAQGADFSFNPSDWENAWAALTKGWRQG